jgi:16S rRNA (cytosine967-C5)-methyltransferase
VSAPAPARACAYVVVRRVFEGGAYTDLALRAQADAAGLDARDRALAMRLAYGAVQRRGTLDDLIATLARRSVARIDAPLLAALRLGLYELLYLRGAPDRAVVDDAVQLAKHASHGRGHGLVNAVLRRAAGEGPALLAALEGNDDTPEGAAVAHSHPLWIVRLWWGTLGPRDTRALLVFDNEPAELALRANTLVTDAPTLARELAGGAAGAEAAPAAGRDGASVDAARATKAGGHGVRHTGAQSVRSHLDAAIPEAVVLDGAFDAHGSPLWCAGAFLAQSRAAMLPARILAPEPGERVLDLCAAPGGKSTQLAALMGGEGQVVAVERHPRRAAELRETARRLRAKNVRVVVADAARALPGEQPGAFDRVLVDPPCSGLGTLQAHPDLRWRVTAGQVPELARKQAAMLAAGADAVRPGGVLVYSTCTISPVENERQIFAFLESHPEFALDETGFASTGAGGTALDAPLAGGGEAWSDGGAECGQARRDGAAERGEARRDRAAKRVKARPDGAAERGEAWSDGAAECGEVSPDVSPGKVRDGLPGTPLMGGAALQTLPHRDHTAGFFIARLRRRG